jgi:hypothetical protein
MCQTISAMWFRHPFKLQSYRSLLKLRNSHIQKVRGLFSVGGGDRK